MRKPAARDRYLELFDFAPVTYLTLDGAGLVTQINLAGCTLLSVVRAHIIGHPLLVHFVERDRRTFLDHLRRCRSGDDVIETELRMRSRDGRIIHCRLYTKGALESGRRMLPTVIIDQTDRLSLERAHRKAEEQRDDAQRERETARADIVAKERLIAMVSHELRTPLTPALVASTLLEKATSGDEQLRKLAGTVRRNIEIEAGLVDDLLDLAKIGRDHVDLRREVANVHLIVEDAVDVCKAAADEKRITIAVNLLAEYVHTTGDEARLRQVFWNLMNNAIKFSDPGATVQVRTYNPSDRLLRVSVRDYGAGMDRETLASLFSPFEPAMPHGGARRGLGLGLTICKGIVDAHGGQVWAASEGPGRGSTFEVELGVAQDFSPAKLRTRSRDRRPAKRDCGGQPGSTETARPPKLAGSPPD